jgi:hypothetical protein
LDFFHSLAGLGCGGDVGGDDPWADPSTLLRDLFFPAPTFDSLDEDGFIIQVHWVFTRIRSGATLVASSGGARLLAIYGAAAEATVDGHLARSTPVAAIVGNKKP